MPSILQIIFGITVFLALTTRVTPIFGGKEFLYVNHGEPALLACPITDSPYTEWYKDNTRGAVIASYNSQTKNATYDSKWENDVELSVDEGLYFGYRLIIKIDYRRDRGQILCVARNGSQLQRLADYVLRIYFPPIIRGIIQDSVRVLSENLTLTADETVQLELTVDLITHPFFVNWIVGGRDVTSRGTNETALKLTLQVTDDMQGRELRVIVLNGLGKDTMVKHIRINEKLEQTTPRPSRTYGEEKCVAWRQIHKIVVGVLVAALSVTVVSLVAVCVAMRRRCPKENVKAISKPGMERALQNHYSTVPPIITGLLLDSVRVLSDTLTLTADATVQLEATVDLITHPFYVNWIVGGRDVTSRGTNETALKLTLQVTDDMQGRELRVIVLNGLGKDTIVKHIRINGMSLHNYDNTPGAETSTDEPPPYRYLP